MKTRCNPGQASVLKKHWSWLVCSLVAAVAVPVAAAPSFVRSSPNGIDGFELRYGGFFWWNTHGVCGGEFPNTAAVEFSGTPQGARSTVALACDILTGFNDNAVRDGVYAYYFAGRQLVRKALNASVANFAQNVATPPFSPTLPVGQLGSPLELRNGKLYFARYTAGTGLNGIFRLDLDTNNDVVEEGSFDDNSPVVRIAYFDYDDNRTVNALAVLTENRNLYRIKLNPIRGETVTTLLATQVNDFSIRTGGFALANTYIFATKGPRAVLGDIPAPGPAPGTLWHVNPETGSETLLYTAQADNVLIGVTTVGHDSEDDTYIFLAEGIVSGSPFAAITEVALRRHSAKVLTEPWDTILLQGGGWNLRATGQTLYMLRTNGILSMPTGAPALQFDMRAVGLEAVQAIQSFTHAVPLVANRPSWVRGYASLPLNTTGQPEWIAGATLRGFLNGSELPGGPLEPIDRSVPVRAGTLSSHRSSITNSFLFELPSEWTRTSLVGFDQLQFILTVNGDLAVPETVANPLANNSVTSPAVGLFPGAKPCLVMVPVESVGPEYYAPDDPNFPGIIERARALMPVEDFDVHPFGMTAGDPDDPLNFQWEGSDAEDPDEAAEENRDYRMGQWGQANDQAEDLGSESDICDSDDIHYVAMIHDDAVIAPPGGQGERPGNACGIRMTAGNPGTQNPRGGRTLAHELGHNYGRKHVACGDFPDSEANFDNIPFPESLGNPNENLPEATFGFDPMNFLVLRPTEACDIMSYGGTRWPTAYYWNALFAETLNAAPAANARQRAATTDGAGFVMLVRGIIYTNSAWFRHFSVLPESAAPPRVVARSRAESLAAARQPGPFWLQQLDATGQLLGQSAILPRDPSSHEETRPGRRFNQYVDFLPGARTLQLVQSNAIFAERFISPNAPVLQLSTPVVDLAAQTVALNWTASDADGDPLRFSIHFSADNGARWGALQTAYRKLAITLSTRWLPGGANCRLRVIAHDGANSTIAVSAPFSLPKHAPEPRIFGVREGGFVPFGQPLRLRGLALDAEEGSAHVAQSWRLTGPRTLTATGSAFTAFSLLPGNYTAAYTALDSDGQSNTLSRAFEVGPVTIPEAPAAPVLDGFANDDAYARAVSVMMQDGGDRFPARLVHAGGHLYVSFANLQYANVLRQNTTVGLRVDVNASGGGQAGSGDVGFFVDEDGVPFQEVAQGGNMVETLQPAGGFTAVIQRGPNSWSAELEIADALLGGWNHAARLMLAHDPAEWPPNAITNRPGTWVSAWLGAAAVPATNRLPVAQAGSDVAVAFSRPGEITLDGGASFDPEGAPLSFTWRQMAGPTVTLTNTNAAHCDFTAPVVGSPTEYRFRLTVNDGAQDSAPDEVRVLIRPPATPAPAVPPRGLAMLRLDGRLQVRLMGEPGRAYRVQTSTDLRAWSDVRTVVGDINGAIDYTADFKLMTDAARFFRAISP